MIPLHDDNPTLTPPFVTIGLIITASFAFLWQLSMDPESHERVLLGLGFIPAVLFGERALPPQIELVPPSLTLISSMFLHGGWMHLIGNMLYLWIFGNNIEDAMGHWRFIVFYLVCGVAAALAQGVVNTHSTVPTIGASGAISGVLGAYLVLYPRARILVLVFLGIFATTLRLPALVVLGFWFVLQFVNASLGGAAGQGVAWWAHLGGFLSGVALVLLFRMRRPRPLPVRRGPKSRGPRSRGPWG